MTESISQTQIINDTNRFGKHKGSSSLGSRTRSLAAGNSTSGSMFIRRRSSSSSSLSSTSSTNTTTTATPTSTNTSNITTSTSTTATIPTTVTAATTAISNNNNNNNTLTSSSLPSSSTSVVYTIVLKPLNNQFPTKSLEISEHNKCKIGRQSNAKTTPKPLNGYFNSKVLSRSHALLWCQDHKVWIKDTKSSNGTFLNGKRLSPELEESEAFEIKTGDHIEFGIDITGEDGLILYHKVACDISVFNIPLDQIDFNTLQNFNIATGSSPQRKPESNGSQDRRGATISARSGHNGTFRNTSTLDHPSSPLSMEDTANNRSKNWDVVLAKLEIELQRSQQVEKELMDMKGFISDANTYYTEEKTKKVDSLNILLQQQLYEAQNRIKEYSKKTKLQEQAMSAAQKQLLQLQKTIEKTKTNHSNGLLHGSDINQLRKELEQVRLQLDEEKINHHKELMIEKQKCVDYEEKCLQLEKKLLLLEKSSSSLKKQQDLISSNGQLPTGNQNNGFFMGFFDALQLRSVQILLGILLAIISALFYALIAI